MSGSKLIPGLRYHDAPAAIEFLCKAFGFREHLVVPGENGTIAHAQLTLGDDMIMLGSVRDDDYGQMVRPPNEDGVVTQAVYVVVDDIQAHHDRAKAAGANIVKPLEAQDHGGSLYSARDPGGQLWNFGDYDPWAELPSS